MTGAATVAGAVALAAAAAGCGATQRTDEVVVPNLIGRDSANAQRVLAARGLRWRWDRRGTPGPTTGFRPVGVILAQTPAVGRRVRRGAFVVLVPGSGRIGAFPLRPS